MEIAIYIKRKEKPYALALCFTTVKICCTSDGPTVVAYDCTAVCRLRSREHQPSLFREPGLTRDVFQMWYNAVYMRKRTV